MKRLTRSARRATNPETSGEEPEGEQSTSSQDQESSRRTSAGSRNTDPFGSASTSPEKRDGGEPVRPPGPRLKLFLGAGSKRKHEEMTNSGSTSGPSSPEKKVVANNKSSLATADPGPTPRRQDKHQTARNLDPGSGGNDDRSGSHNSPGLSWKIPYPFDSPPRERTNSQASTRKISPSQLSEVLDCVKDTFADRDAVPGGGDYDDDTSSEEVDSRGEGEEEEPVEMVEERPMEQELRAKSTKQVDKDVLTSSRSTSLLPGPSGRASASPRSAFGDNLPDESGVTALDSGSVMKAEEESTASGLVIGREDQPVVGEADSGFRDTDVPSWPYDLADEVSNENVQASSGSNGRISQQAMSALMMKAQQERLTKYPFRFRSQSPDRDGSQPKPTQGIQSLVPDDEIDTLLGVPGEDGSARAPDRADHPGEAPVDVDDEPLTEPEDEDQAASIGGEDLLPGSKRPASKSVALPMRPARKKRKWLKRGEVDPDDPVAVARQKEKHGLIDQAIVNLDEQHKQVVAGTHKQLLHMYDDLASRRKLHLSRAEERYAAIRHEFKHTTEFANFCIDETWEQLGDEIIVDISRRNEMKLLQLKRERAINRRKPDQYTHLRHGAGGGGWNFVDATISRDEIPLVPTFLDGVVRERKDYTVSPCVLDPASIEADIKAMDVRQPKPRHPTRTSTTPQAGTPAAAVVASTSATPQVTKGAVAKSLGLDVLLETAKLHTEDVKKPSVRLDALVESAKTHLEDLKNPQVADVKPSGPASKTGDAGKGAGSGPFKVPSTPAAAASTQSAATYRLPSAAANGSTPASDVQPTSSTSYRPVTATSSAVPAQQPRTATMPNSATSPGSSGRYLLKTAKLESSAGNITSTASNGAQRPSPVVGANNGAGSTSQPQRPSNTTPAASSTRPGYPPPGTYLCGRCSKLHRLRNYIPPGQAATPQSQPSQQSQQSQPAQRQGNSAYQAQSQYPQQMQLGQKSESGLSQAQSANPPKPGSDDSASPQQQQPSQQLPRSSGIAATTATILPQTHSLPQQQRQNSAASPVNRAVPMPSPTALPPATGNRAVPMPTSAPRPQPPAASNSAASPVSRPSSITPQPQSAPTTTSGTNLARQEPPRQLSAAQNSWQSDPLRSSIGSRIIRTAPRPKATAIASTSYHDRYGVLTTTSEKAQSQQSPPAPPNVTQKAANELTSTAGPAPKSNAYTISSSVAAAIVTGSTAMQPALNAAKQLGQTQYQDAYGRRDSLQTHRVNGYHPIPANATGAGKEGTGVAAVPSMPTPVPSSATSVSSPLPIAANPQRVPASPTGKTAVAAVSPRPESDSPVASKTSAPSQVADAVVPAIPIDSKATKVDSDVPGTTTATGGSENFADSQSRKAKDDVKDHQEVDCDSQFASTKKPSGWQEHRGGLGRNFIASLSGGGSSSSRHGDTDLATTSLDYSRFASRPPATSPSSSTSRINGLGTAKSGIFAVPVLKASAKRAVSAPKQRKEAASKIAGWEGPGSNPVPTEKEKEQPELGLPPGRRKKQADVTEGSTTPVGSPAKKATRKPRGKQSRTAIESESSLTASAGPALSLNGSAGSATAETAASEPNRSTGTTNTASADASGSNPAIGANSALQRGINEGKVMQGGPVRAPSFEVAAKPLSIALKGNEIGKAPASARKAFSAALSGFAPSSVSPLSTLAKTTGLSAWGTDLSEKPKIYDLADLEGKTSSEAEGKGEPAGADRAEDEDDEPRTSPGKSSGGTGFSFANPQLRISVFENTSRKDQTKLTKSLDWRVHK